MKQLIVKYWKKMSVEDALFIFSMFGDNITQMIPPVSLK